VVELAELVGIDVPHTRAVYACTKLLQETLSHFGGLDDNLEDAKARRFAKK
jgi:hypothetical protein